jgi:hypothetical protein
MRISDTSIQKLQMMLQNQNGREYDSEHAQAAGRAILKLVGIKLYQKYLKEVPNVEFETTTL